MFRNGNKKKILVVEDDPEQAEMLRDRFHEEGYACVISEGRADYVQKMNNQEFDLIVTDLNVKGSSGGDTVNGLVEMAKINKAKVPIIIVSGYLDPKTLKECGVKIVGAFVKPANIDLLLGKVNEVLNTKLML